MYKLVSRWWLVVVLPLRNSVQKPWTTYYLLSHGALISWTVLSCPGLFILEYVLLDTFSAAQFSSSLLWWTWNSTGSSWKHDITGAGGELGMYHFVCKRKLLELPFGGDKEIQGGVHCKRCRGDLHRGSCKSRHTVGPSICEAEVGFLQLIKRHKWCKNKPWPGLFLGSKCRLTPRYPGEVPDLSSNTAILILHLSLTDFLYCLLGLPFVLATLHHGYFPWVVKPEKNT